MPREVAVDPATLAPKDPARSAMEAAVQLLAADLDVACNEFQDTLRQHSFCWDAGGFGAIENGRVFAMHLKDLINAIRNIVGRTSLDLARLVTRQQSAGNDLNSALLTSAVRATVAEHCNPRTLLRRAFPTPDGRGILLPPGLISPEHEHTAPQHICQDDQSIARIGTSASGTRRNRAYRPDGVCICRCCRFQDQA